MSLVPVFQHVVVHRLAAVSRDCTGRFSHYVKAELKVSTAGPTLRCARIIIFCHMLATNQSRLENATCEQPFTCGATNDNRISDGIKRDDLSSFRFLAWS